MDYSDFQNPPNLPFVVMDGRLSEGVPVKVLLDSGAVAPFQLMLAPKAAAAAKVEIASRADATAQGASGARTAVTSAKVKSFSLGPVVMHGVTAGVFPALDQISAKVGAPIDVLVGAEFLKGRLVEIDYGRHRISFAAAEPRGSGLPASLAAKRPLMLVQARINGEGPFTLALDTGASQTLLSPATAMRSGLKASGSGAATGAGGSLAVTTANGSVRFGPHQRNVTFLISSAVEKIAEAAGSPIDGVLGADVFGSGLLTLDYARGRVWTELGRP